MLLTSQFNAMVICGYRHIRCRCWLMNLSLAYKLFAAAMDDEIECAICTEVFTDPRVLPCVHTFCLKCIQGWSKEKLPGKTLACPLCRNGLTIPKNGVEGLPRNLYAEKMLRVRELTSVEAQSPLCNMCTYRATSEAAKIDPATTYCLQWLFVRHVPAFTRNRKHHMITYSSISETR